MSLVINGNTIPATGKVLLGSTDLTKVVYNGTTVWEKQTKITPPVAQLSNYVNGLSGDTSGCSGHAGAPHFGTSIWYASSNTTQTKSTTIAPKSPYTKIKCTCHVITEGWDGDGGEIKINGETKSGTFTIGPVSSFTIDAKAWVKRYPNADSHWKSVASVCLYNVELSS